ncbi:hypothetical protein VSDG_08772 [Cytospora chrysosperma]|uniref:Calcineurin-like phosphoesterase domain-containing protein n=1 Tax=Cytospora chrysosperma TaxID=252740 RepID=A0A423VGQ8_CYTCH|nr:hypothetical protein VSDG_08772 [Valsa sordida]
MFARQSAGSGLDSLLRRPRPSLWQKFRRDPVVFLARSIYKWRHVVPAQPLTNAVSVVCVSDTHNTYPDIPSGDILIHAGDLTQSGSFTELQAALDWLKSQPHPHKLVIAGNHDLLLDPSLDATAAGRGAAAAAQREQLDWGDIKYLQDSTTELTCPNGRRLRVYGSPNSSRHGNWAFQYPRSESDKTWRGAIPDDVDILITHGPPRAHLDVLRLGCPALLEELWRVRPRLHVFGHVHEGYGSEWLSFDTLQEAYERTVIAGGGLWNGMHVVAEFVRATLLRSPTEPKSLLVNPCMVGGLRDDEREKPIVVRI